MNAPTPATGQVAERGESPWARLWAVAVWLFIPVAAVAFLVSLPAAWEARRQAVNLLPVQSMPANVYVAVGLVLAAILAGTCLAAATVLARSPGLGRLAAFVLAGLGVGFPQTVPHLTEQWALAAPAVVALEGIGLFSLVAFLVVFPLGRFRAGWTRWILLPAGVATVAPLVGELTGRPDAIPDWLVAVSWCSLLVGVPVALFVNVRTARSGDRARTRRLGLVLVLAVVVSIAALIAAGWVQASAWGRPGSAADLTTQFLVVVTFQFLAVSITSAVVSSTWLDPRGVLGTVFTSGYLALAAVAVLVTVSSLVDRFDTALGPGVDALVPVVAVAAIATAVHPAFLALRSPVVRLVYGRDAAPAEFVARLLQRMRSAGSLEAQRDHALREVGVALGADAADLTENGARAGPSERGASPLVPVFDALEALQRLWLAERREVSARAATAQAVEDERVRLRNELHDGLGPTVGAAILKLQASANLASAKPGEASSLVDEAQSDLRGLVDQIRTIVRGLRPPSLDELGLCGALGSLVARQETSGLTIDLQTEGMEDALPAAVETAVFRIVSEALENVRRHAGASVATVELERKMGAHPGRHEIMLTIRDNGRGFAPGVPQDADGIGLNSMRQRAEALGGTFTVTGRTGGVIIRVLLPVETIRPLPDGESAASFAPGPVERWVGHG